MIIKKVPGHLFQFEEKIFGMTLTQLLSDLAALFSLIGVTSSVSLLTRLAIIAPTMLIALVLVHGKMSGYTMLYWLYLLVRFRFLPRHTVRRAEEGKGASVQECWIQFNELSGGTGGMVRGAQAMYWAAFEIESKYALRYLSETDQVRLYGRFKQFLDGLSFPVKFISLVSSLDATRDPTLMAQQQVVAELTPRLQQLQMASIKHQQAVAQHSTVTRHFVIVSASTFELVRERASRFSPVLGKAPTVTNAQVKNELKTRVSIVSKTLSQLDVQATLLDDASLLTAYAACLAPGHHIASNDSRESTVADRLAPSTVELRNDAVVVEIERRSGTCTTTR